MTREQAIKYLRSSGMSEEQINTVVAALSAEPCSDAISRQAVHEAIEKWAGSMNVLVALPTREVRPLLDSIHDLPSVNPQEPKTGQWVHREDMDYLDKNKVMHKHFMCQDCGFIHDFIDGHMAQYQYCPSCGAKMESEGVKKDCTTCILDGTDACVTLASDEEACEGYIAESEDKE